MEITKKEIKELSQNGINFLIREEGLKLTAYLDSANVWTISIGCTYYPDGSRVKKGDVVTREEAINIFKNIVKNYEQAVSALARDDINQNQFDALVSLCYNIGVGAFRKSTLLKKVNANPKNPTIASEFAKWRMVGGRVNKGLESRRAREAKLYFS